MALSRFTPIGLAGYTATNNSARPVVSPQGFVSQEVDNATIGPTGAYMVGRPAPKGKIKPAPLAPKGSGSTGQKKPKLVPASQPYKPPAPKKPAWQDADYNSQIAAIERALNLYKAGMTLERTQAGAEYAENARNMDSQKGRDLKDMEEDFAARGIVTSGVYGTSVGDYNTEWGNQRNSLTRQYDDSLADILQAYNVYLNDVATQREQARLDAIRRRAQALEENPSKSKKSSSSKLKDASQPYKPKKDKSGSSGPGLKPKTRPR